jgi:cAMP-specific phosphodiesterase 4
LETFTVLFAAAIHDVGHLGLNNQFLVQTKHDLAVLYHDESVMENHHLAVAFRLLLGEDCNMLSNLAEDEQRQVKRNAVRLVLATDITREVNNLAALRTLVETSKVSKDGVLLLNNYADRIQVLECLLHCADVSNPARPSALSIQWTDCIVEEFYCQGDEERRLGLPVSPMMDRHNPSVEKSQVAFIEVICYPLWESWAELVHPCGQVMLDNLLANKAHWQDRLSPPPGLSFGSYSDSSVCILGEAVKV